jgi:type I restriction-modification system DNA methylase subunit
MEPTQLNWIANVIWGIADDVLRDLYVRGKYRDVILPMMVLRRLDAVLEPTKGNVLRLRDSLDESGIVHQDAALRQAAGQAFYNTSASTAFLRTSRRSSTASSSTTRSPGSPRPTPWAPSSRSSSIPRSI